MKISFDQLKSMVVFAQVVEQGSLSGAARVLELSRAVVSYHIKKLESQLGVQLLNRTTRSISVTDAGKHFFERCQRIAQEAEAATEQVENLRDEPEGVLKISCPVNVGLQLVLPVLNRFQQQYPKILLDVNLTDEVVNIIKDGIDLAIRGAPLVDSGLQATKLSTAQTCLCASPEYLNKFGRPTSVAELDRHQWVVYKLAPKFLQLSKAGRSYSIRVKGNVSTNNAAARTAFVEGGHGLARIPLYDALPKIQAGKLELLMKDFQLPEINLYGVFPPRANLSKKLQLLIDCLKRHFKQVEAQSGLGLSV